MFVAVNVSNSSSMQAVKPQLCTKSTVSKGTIPSILPTAFRIPLSPKTKCGPNVPTLGFSVKISNWEME